jgi:hypothetical protein
MSRIGIRMLINQHSKDKKYFTKNFQF